MQDNILKKLIALINEKFIFNRDFGEKMFPGKNIENFLKPKTYLDGIHDEIDEIKQELSKNNSVHLEDELGDVLWNYLNLLYCLEKEGYIDAEKVYERCLKKYSERTEGMKKGTSWDDIKLGQKRELLKEHNKKYNA